MIFNVFIIICMASNIFWGRRETINYLSRVKTKTSMPVPKVITVLLKLNCDYTSISILVTLLCFIVYFPTILLSVVVIGLALFGIGEFIFCVSSCSINSLNTFILGVGTAVYYWLAYLVFKVMAVISDDSFVGFSFVKKRIAQLPKYIWVFIVACLPIPIVTNGGVITLFTCLMGICVCIYLALVVLEKEVMPRNKITIFLVYILTMIVAATWGISYLAVEIISSF